MTIKVAVIDDQDIIRLGIQQSLSTAPHIMFVGGYATLEDFCEVAPFAKVNVVLLDDSLPGIDTVGAIRMVHQCCWDASIVVLSSRLTSLSIHQVIRAGASGVICKKEPVQTIVVAGIQYTHSGKIYLSPAAALIAGGISQIMPLSQNLYDVLRLMARGCQISDIMQELDITRQALYGRRNRLREILGVVTNEQVVAEALRLGLLTDDD